MPAKGAYERRGNANQRKVRQRASDHLPISQREMKKAFDAWQEDKKLGKPRISSSIIMSGETKEARTVRRKREG